MRAWIPNEVDPNDSAIARCVMASPMGDGPDPLETVPPRAQTEIRYTEISSNRDTPNEKLQRISQVDVMAQVRASRCGQEGCTLHIQPATDPSALPCLQPDSYRINSKKEELMLECATTHA